MKTIDKLLRKKGYDNFTIKISKTGYNIYFNNHIWLGNKLELTPEQKRVLKDALSFMSSSYIRAYNLKDIKVCIEMLPDLAK